MNSRDYHRNQDLLSPEQRRRRLLDAINQEARRIRALRQDLGLREQERHVASGISTVEPPRRPSRATRLLSLPTTPTLPPRESLQRPRTSSVPISRYDLDDVPLEVLQLALRMSTAQCRPTGDPSTSMLPYGPSHSTLSQLSSCATALPISQGTKRKRELVLESSDSHHQTIRNVPPQRQQQQQRHDVNEAHMSQTKKPRNVQQDYSFPLPPLTARSNTRIRVSLNSYKSLWESSRKSDFVRRIQLNQVPVEKDTSITQQYSKRKKKR